MKLKWFFLVFFLLLGTRSSAQTQIRPRVLLMVDTSGSMTEQIDDTSKDTGGDGSDTWLDSLGLSRNPTSTPGFQYGVGFSQPANQCAPANPPTDFRGRLSKMFSAKKAVNNVLDGAGDIDWGLMRYAGKYCDIFTDPTAKVTTDHPLACPNGRNDCGTGTGRSCGAQSHLCICAADADCPPDWYCDTSHQVQGALRCEPHALAKRFCSGGGECLSGTCTSGACTCANDGQCSTQEYCISGKCTRDFTQCIDKMFSMTDKRGDNTCTDRQSPAYSLSGTYQGSCGVTATCKIPEYCDNNGNNCSGNGGCDLTNFGCKCTSNSNCGRFNPGSGSVQGVCNLGYCVSPDSSCSRCQTVQTCSGAGDCMGGACNPIAGRAASACGCSGNSQCPASQGYTCVSGTCTYSRGCVIAGGFIEVDPKIAGSNAKVFPWVNGIEDYRGTAGAFEGASGVAVKDPELRPFGLTPLAGAARTATDWYAAIRDYSLNTPACLSGSDSSSFCDPKIKCRPYVLVQLTDGVDTCDGPGPNGANGPVAAAADFANASVAGARVTNKVYVVGLSVTSMNDRNELNSIAIAGGTEGARFANSQADIEAALSDIVTSSVLVEKCNGADDDCNGLCDETFPDVTLTDPNCLNYATRQTPVTCNNGGQVGTHCYSEGAYRCSADGLSEECSAITCTGDPEDPANPTYAVCARQESMHGCNGLDDDCNGVVDDCTPFVAGSCCSSAMCPACNPTGVPMKELCNGCDDDCDGIVDDNLMDPAVGVVGGPPCVPLTPGMDQPPCMPGVTACVNGMVVCQGEVFPMPNQCDGISRDCTGKPNPGGNCPAGSMCFQGNCLEPCADTEFPCPGGFVCKEPEHLCVPDACQKLACPSGDLCNVAPDGGAGCVDPCDHVTCPSGYTCKAGACTMTTCANNGCPDGKVCSEPGPACVDDPCNGVTCPNGSFCNASGNCEKTCATICPGRQVCVDGNCQNDPCALMSCLAGEACAISGSLGSCVEDLCAQTGCQAGAICCGGQCRHDPCAAISCGTGGTCVVDHNCNAGCQLGDQIVGAGGGGLACAFGGGGAPPRSPGGLLVILLYALVRWRRREEVR